MATTRKAESTTDAGNGFVPPARTVSTGGIPARVGRPRNNYAGWKPEIDALYDNLGDAFTYADVPKCQSVANGLRREYGVKAVTQEIDKATGVGTLHLQVPVLTADDGTHTVDDAKMDEIREKYSKK